MNINTPEIEQAFKQNDLSRFTVQELMDELDRRGFDYLFQSALEDTCEHGMEMGYCPIEDCEGGY